MAKQNVNVGVSANDGTGDTLRDGAIKLNNVINELYTQLGDNTNLQVSIGSPSTNQVLKWNGTVFTEGDLASSNLTDVDLTGIGNGQVLKWNTANSRFQPGDDLQGSGGGGGNAITNLTNNGSNNVVISTHFLPNTDNTYDLGSNSLKFRDLYLSSSTIWMDDTGISIGSDQEITRRKRKAHTVHSIDTGATRTITSKLASENSTEEEGLRLRFNAMKVGTPLEIEDVNGNKIEATFASFTAEAGATRGTVTVSATGTANQTQELAVSGDIKISSKNKLITEQEDGAVDLGAQKLKFGFGDISFDTDGILELPASSSIRFGTTGSAKELKFDGNNNLDLPTGTDIRFGGDAAKSIKFDGSGNLEVPENAEIRFGSGGTKKLSLDASNNLELPTGAEIKIGTKRIKLDTNGELQVANDGTTFEDVDRGFKRQGSSAPAGASVIKGYNNATVYKPSPTLLYSFSAVGQSNYTVNGPGLPSGGSTDPNIILYRGFTYDFNNTTGSSHPLRIQSTTGLSGTPYTTGLSGSQTAMQSFTVPFDAPTTLYYQCTIHSDMNGTIEIR